MNEPADVAVRMARGHAAAAYWLACELSRDGNRERREMFLPILRRRLRDAFKATLRIRRAA